MALKKSSSLIIIGASVTESGANTFTQARVDLQLNPLDNEVFVVQAIDLMVGAPDFVSGADSIMQGSLTTTSQPIFPRFSNTNVMAMQILEITSSAATNGVSFTSGSFETPPTNLDYIGIISTNDFHLQAQGTGNTGAHSLECKVYGYRAKADAATYASLVQSELLSS